MQIGIDGEDEPESNTTGDDQGHEGERARIHASLRSERKATRDAQANHAQGLPIGNPSEQQIETDYYAQRDPELRKERTGAPVQGNGDQGKARPALREEIKTQMRRHRSAQSGGKRLKDQERTFADTPKAQQRHQPAMCDHRAVHEEPNQPQLQIKVGEPEANHHSECCKDRRKYECHGKFFLVRSGTQRAPARAHVLIYRGRRDGDTVARALSSDRYGPSGDA